MKREYPMRPMVGVGAVIVRDGKILLVRRASDPGRGKWSIPGGLVELGESTYEALVREVKEECGLDVEVDRLIDIMDVIVRTDNGRIKYHFVVIDFLVKLKGGSLQARDDVLEAKWIPLDDVEQYDLTRTFRAFLKRNFQELKKYSSVEL